MGLFKNISFFLEYLFFVLLRKFVILLGYKRSKSVGRFLGRLAFKYLKTLRDYAIRNAKVVYGVVDDRIMNILEKSFENVGVFVIDSFFLDVVDNKNYGEFVIFEGTEYLNEGLSEGKGLIVVSGHFGNWEFLAGIPARLGMFNVAVVMNRQVNPYTEKLIVETRRKSNLETIYNQPEEVKKIISYLKKNWIVGMVVDQAYYFDPIYVDFFGKPAPTARGPAVFHLKLGSPIVMARSILLEDGRYMLKFYPPMKFNLEYNDENVKFIMRKINEVFEEWIRENPTQWFSWTHPRWDVSGIVIRKKTME